MFYLRENGPCRHFKDHSVDAVLCETCTKHSTLWEECSFFLLNVTVQSNALGTVNRVADVHTTNPRARSSLHCLLGLLQYFNFSAAIAVWIYMWYILLQ